MFYKHSNFCLTLMLPNSSNCGRTCAVFVIHTPTKSLTTTRCFCLHSTSTSLICLDTNISHWCHLLPHSSILMQTSHTGPTYHTQPQLHNMALHSHCQRACVVRTHAPVCVVLYPLQIGVTHHQLTPAVSICRRQPAVGCCRH